MLLAKRSAIAAITLYVFIIALLYLFQRDLMYLPEQREHVPPSHYAMLAGVREASFTTPDNIHLVSWYVPPPEGRPTILILHGNGGSLRGLRYRLAHFRDEAYGVLLLAYRGYSGNAGTPTEEGLYTDARTALNWLNAQGTPDDRIVLYGESLGTGVATKLAVEREVKAVILESPYTSTTDVAAYQFPFVPAHWLMKDRFESLQRISKLSEPLLIMHGSVDQVIPQEMGRKLFAAANEPKQGFWPVGAGHGDIFDKGGFVVAARFIERIEAEQK